MHNIDKGLSIVPVEVADHLNPILAHQYCLDQRDESMQGGGVKDEGFAAWLAETVKGKRIWCWVD